MVISATTLYMIVVCAPEARLDKNLTATLTEAVASNI